MRNGLLKLIFLLVLCISSACTVFTSKVTLGKKGTRRDNKGMTQFPMEVLDDTTITSLSLFGNKLMDLPPEFTRLQQLEVLYLGKNEFSQFPEEICRLKSLRILSLAYNNLDSLPECLCELENLEWLLLNNNQLVHLPDSMGKLKKLEQLYLKRNVLRKLPKSMYDASALQVVDVSYNELPAIDSSFSQLRQLRELAVYRAGFLLELPESICDLRFLERIYVDQTVVLPTCIFARKTDRLVVFFQER